jgi:hypothetical protein
MVQLVTTSDTLPPSAEAAALKCDQDGCDEPAVFAYRWEWGATGQSCAHHATLLQQTAENLNRKIALHPIVAPGPAPLLRDERVQLVAKHLVLEAELEEAKSRGLEVYRRNGDLQVQLNTAVVRERELKAQLQDAALTVERVQKRCDELDQKNGELLVELDRLRALETFVHEREETERRDRGLDTGETPNVVDG